jgi:hypothetical protein
MLCGLVWSISFGLIALVESPILRFVITNVYIIAVPLSAISWFIFCYEFTFRKAIPKRVFYCLSLLYFYLYFLGLTHITSFTLLNIHISPKRF